MSSRQIARVNIRQTPRMFRNLMMKWPLFFANSCPSKRRFIRPIHNASLCIPSEINPFTSILTGSARLTARPSVHPHQRTFRQLCPLAMKESTHRYCVIHIVRSSYHHQLDSSRSQTSLNIIRPMLHSTQTHCRGANCRVWRKHNCRYAFCRGRFS